MTENIIYLFIIFFCEEIRCGEWLASSISIGVFNTWRYFPDKRSDNYPFLYLYVFAYGDWLNNDIVYLHFARNFRLMSVEYFGHYVISEPWFEFNFSLLSSLAIKTFVFLHNFTFLIWTKLKLNRRHCLQFSNPQTGSSSALLPNCRILFRPEYLFCL